MARKTGNVAIICFFQKQATFKIPDLEVQIKQAIFYYSARIFKYVDSEKCIEVWTADLKVLLKKNENKFSFQPNLKKKIPLSSLVSITRCLYDLDNKQGACYIFSFSGNSYHIYRQTENIEPSLLKNSAEKPPTIFESWISAIKNAAFYLENNFTVTCYQKYILFTHKQIDLEPLETYKFNDRNGVGCSIKIENKIYAACSYFPEVYVWDIQV